MATATAYSPPALVNTGPAGGRMSRTIMSEPMDDHDPSAFSGSKSPPLNMSMGIVTGEQPKAQLLKRVLSGGSSASTSASTPREALATPPATQIPLSPSSGSGSGSGGNRTPRAKKAVLANAAPPPPGDGKIQPLVTDMDGLQVQSPTQVPKPLSTSSARPRGGNNTSKAPTQHTRAASSSTDSSSTGYHPMAPDHLGSSYGSEGFPMGGSMDDIQMTTPDPATAARIAFTDEAVKSINGTSTVFQGPTHPSSTPDPYNLPRTYAHFVKPQPRTTRSPDQSRQSSTSSTTTEASTSSEESDLCVPTLEWVNVQPHAPNALHHLSAGKTRTASPGQMAPPPLHRSSPRRAPAQPALPNPVFPTNGSFYTDNSSSSESLTPADNDDEDDNDTVGHGRERSPSASSISEESGLDLLWKAAKSQEGTPTDTPESRGKRKAVTAEAVAQWRNSGIPTGTEVKPPEGTDGSHAGPPKKRRRSEVVSDAAIDPALRSIKAEGGVGSRSASVNAGGVIEEDGESGWESDRPASDNDSEYGSKPKAGGRGVISKSGRGGGKKARGGRVSTGTAASTGGAGGSGKGGGGGKKGKKGMENGDNGSGGAGGGGGGGGGGGRRGSNAGAAAAAGGVQCEYVNPLPPYNRCSDVFTRKYDLPRHMARHARREGELVYEGKLSEDKALLWKTIKDKPKVTCEKCGESFTRMDALKRHQTKQHH